VCSVDEEPGDDEVLQVLSEARRLAVDAELRDDCAQQSLVTSSLHRLCDIRHQVELPSHSVSLTLIQSVIDTSSYCYVSNSDHIDANIKTNEQVPSHPQPYQKITDIHLLRSDSLSISNLHIHKLFVSFSFTVYMHAFHTDIAYSSIAIL